MNTATRERRLVTDLCLGPSHQIARPPLVLGVGGQSIPQQKAALRNLIALPAWEAVPAPVQKSVAEFLARKGTIPITGRGSEG